MITYLLWSLLYIRECNKTHILLELDFLKIYEFLSVLIEWHLFFNWITNFDLKPIYKQATNKTEMADRPVKCMYEK